MNTNRTDTISSTQPDGEVQRQRRHRPPRVAATASAPPDLGVTPYLAGQFSALVTPAYSETASSGSSAVALSYQSQTTTDTRAEVGVWADKAFRLQDDATFWLRGRAGYAHDWWNNTFLNANFLSLPTSSFTMAGVTPPANIGLASVMSEIRDQRLVVRREARWRIRQRRLQRRRDGNVPVFVVMKSEPENLGSSVGESVMSHARICYLLVPALAFALRAAAPCAAGARRRATAAARHHGGAAGQRAARRSPNAANGGCGKEIATYKKSADVLEPADFRRMAGSGLSAYGSDHRVAQCPRGGVRPSGSKNADAG